MNRLRSASAALQGQATHLRSASGVNGSTTQEGSGAPRRSVIWLAWTLWILCFALAVPYVWLQALNARESLIYDLAGGLLMLLLATVGALVASRNPRNPIGWLFVASAVTSMIGVIGVEYAVHALVATHGAGASALWIGAISGWLRGLGQLLLLEFLLLLFPDGQLPSRRWRPAVWGIVLLFVVYTMSTLFGQAPFDTRLADAPNLLALLSPELTNAGQALLLLLLIALVGVCGAAVIARFRRATGIERLQLKWFAYATILGLLIFLGILLDTLLDPNANVPPVLFDATIVGLPVAAGIAILRYRLYDIDVIINRTLVYGSLTAVLAAVYFACVVGAQVVSEKLTGQTKSQPVIIVASTLLIAALFTPLRRRLQAIIDRRFYRRKYDAAETLAAFGATLRSEVELGQLREQLETVVSETMQPAHVSLWLRQPDTRRQPRESSEPGGDFSPFG